MSQPTDSSSAEMQVGHALAIIHRILPRLDDAARASEVQTGFQNAIVALKNACTAHGNLFTASAQPPRPAGEAVAADIAAVIAAAVAVVLDSPFRVVAIQKITVPEVISHLNVWAFEGRTQIFTSHKVR
jgi:hypothetical protein